MDANVNKKELIKSYYMEVYRYLCKFGFDKETLNDALQETFVEAYSHMDALRNEEKTKNWLIKIAKSVGIKYKKRCNKELEYEYGFEEDVVNLKYGNTYESDVLIKIILEADLVLLREAMLRLKPKERDTLILFYIYGEKLKDIAEILGESDSNTRTIAKRAKEKVREYLIEGGYEREK